MIIQQDHFVVNLLLDFSQGLLLRLKHVLVRLDLELVSECVWTHDNLAHDIAVVVSRLVVHFQIRLALLAQTDSATNIALEGAAVGLDVVVHALDTILPVLLDLALEQMDDTDLFVEESVLGKGII